MLPPIMDDNSNKTHNLSNHEQQQEQLITEHHPSSFFLNTSTTKNNISTSSSSSTSTFTNSLPTVPFNTSSIKYFFNKTLAKVAQTNLSEYSSTFANSTLANSSLNTSANSHNTKAEAYDGLLVAKATVDVNGGITEASHGFDSYAAAANMAVSSLSNGTNHLQTTTAFPTAQTVATFIAGNKNRAATIIVYPTVSPESIVIPIVSCIFGFPILAFIVICCLRHRAKLARERDRRRNYDMQDHAVSLVRFSPIHRLNYRSSRAISLRPERSLSQGFTSLELDTVVEERCSDVEQTQTEILHPESPMESSTTSCKMSFSSS